MAALDRIRDWFDAPRFCPDDGQPISVTNKPRFDPKTGAKRDSWYWRCPDVSVYHEGGSIQWSQRGTHSVHVHGQGRPRWFREEADDGR
ncbi:MAG TPA: hypothetical protein VI341_13805 [Actinomycetota bacterium]